MRRGFLAAAAALVVVAAVASHPVSMVNSAHRTAAIHRAQHPTGSRLARNPAATIAGATVPSPSATAEPTPDPRVVLAANTQQPLIALTFDLDMTPGMAAQIHAGATWYNAEAIAYLRAQHVHATLFMTGMWAEMYPAIARQLAQDPNFEIGNHSYSHPAFHLPCYRLGGVSRAAQADQIRMAQQAIVSTTGVTPRYFRFPGGCYDRSALDLVHAAGLIPIEWNINSIDAFNPYPGQISATVLSAAKPGSIVIMHLMGGGNAPSTGTALRSIVPALEQRGYQFVTISELLASGTAIEPTDPREVVEAYQPPTPPALVPTVRALPRPTARWCGWVWTKKGWVWACR